MRWEVRIDFLLKVWKEYNKLRGNGIGRFIWVDVEVMENYVRDGVRKSDMELVVKRSYYSVFKMVVLRKSRGRRFWRYEF